MNYHRNNSASPFKQAKLQENKKVFLEQASERPSSLIKPIPIMRRSLPNSSPLRKKLVLQGHKHFSKLAASGRETHLILKNVLKLHHVKFIGTFEFDPYLCLESNLQQLNKCLKKLRGMKRFNLVIRRLDYLNESHLLENQIIRLMRLRKLRLELPTTPNINDEGRNQIQNFILKCYSLKTIEYFPINVGQCYGSSNQFIYKTTSRLLNLEELQIFNYARRAQPEEKCLVMKSLRVCKLKKLDIGWNSNSEWMLVDNFGESHHEEFAKMVVKFPFVEELVVRNTRFTLNSEELVGAIMTFSGLPSLRKFTFESVNGKFHEREILAILYGLPQLRSLWYFNLKVIEQLHISEGVILNFLSVILKQKQIKEFHLYFRRLLLPAEVLSQLAQTISTMENIRLENYKGSFYIYKKESR